jgi:RNA polymerase sigma-70 factor (ECF subfamily)
MTEQELLATARDGDGDAFAHLITAYRAELKAHCYRMLGSLHDAEDALQETLLRAWRSLAGFEGRSSLRSWLYTIATNVCLRAIERRPKRVLPIDYAPAADPHDGPAEPLSESVWLEPYPDRELGVAADLLGPDAKYEQRESIELAFTARETAEALETTPVSIDSALQRAHRTIDARVPAQTQQATLQALGDSGLREIVNRFADAWERNDVDAVVAMLADDARMTMPPQPSWYQGREAIATFLRGWPLSRVKRFRLLPTSANGQPALAGYIWDKQTSSFAAESIVVLTLRDDSIEEITAFRTPELFPLFGLPERLATPQPPEDRHNLEDTMSWRTA